MINEIFQIFICNFEYKRKTVKKINSLILNLQIVKNIIDLKTCCQLLSVFNMKPALKRVLVFALFTLSLLSTYSSFGSLLNYIHKAHGQQHNSHASVLFIVNSVTCIIANLLIPNSSFKIKTMSITFAVMFFGNYLLSFMSFYFQQPAFVVIVSGLGSALAGAGLSISSIISGRYISLICANFKQKEHQGLYFGIYGGILSTNFLFGAIMSALSLPGADSMHDYYLVLAFISFVSIIYGIFVLPDMDNFTYQSAQTKVAEQGQHYTSQEDSVASNINVQPTTTKTASNTKRLPFLSKINRKCLFSNISDYYRMLPLFPFCIMRGLIVGYVFHCLEDLVFLPESEHGNKRLFLTLNLILVGIGGSIGAYLSGLLSDKMSLDKVGFIGVGSMIVCFFIGLACLIQEWYLYSFVNAFLSGFILMFLSNWILVLCAKLYNGKMSAFAVNGQISTLSFILYQFLIRFINPKEMQGFMVYEIGILAVFSLLLLYFIKFIRKRVNQIIKGSKKNIREKQCTQNQDIQLNQVQMQIDSSRIDQNQKKSYLGNNRIEIGAEAEAEGDVDVSAEQEETHQNHCNKQSERRSVLKKKSFNKNRTQIKSQQQLQQVD